jgi:hypothetical protein
VKDRPPAIATAPAILWLLLLVISPPVMPLSPALAPTGSPALAQLFVDFNGGLFTIAPIYLLSIPGFVILFGRRRPIALLLVALVALYVLGASLLWLDTLAGRILTPLAALLAFPTIVAADRIRGPSRGVVVALLILQLGIDITLWRLPGR